MYEHNAKKMILPHEFFLPFAGKLNPNNRWCKLAALIPWEQVETHYKKSLGRLNEGQKAFSVRFALGTLIIQNKKGLSDRDTVDEITENPYLQYFIGLPGFIQEKPFDPSLLVHFRKRLGKDIVNELNNLMFREKEKELKDDDKDDGQPPEEDNSGANGLALEQSKNKGRLILDATCVPVDIQYPTDSRLLNDARKQLEGIIDTLHAPHIGSCRKPRTYRQRARKEYLRFERKRKHTKKEIRKIIRQQLGYVSRNLRTIEEMLRESPLTLLDNQQRKNLLVIKELLSQQRKMYIEKTHSIPNRIVSIHMPFVRPVVRGKKNAAVEFGPKLAISVVNGFTFMEKLSFDAFNEGTTLVKSAERFKKHHGHYPAVICADKIYRNRENLKFCRENHIRLSGPPLGRPSKDPLVLKKQRMQEREDAKIRNWVEGKFGEGKRFYGLGLLMTRLEESCETVIALQLLVMNLERKLRILFFYFSELHFRPEFKIFAVT